MKASSMDKKLNILIPLSNEVYFYAKVFYLIIFYLQVIVNFIL